MRTARILAGLASGALLAVALLALAAVGLGPRTGAYRTLSVLSGSMEPAIPAGSLVVVRPVPSWTVRAGDVITFHAPTPDGRVVTHRVARIAEAGERPVLVTKGDANAAEDPWRARISEDTAWRVSLVVPHAGRAVGFLRRPWLRAVTVLVAPGALAAIWLAGIWRPERPGLGHA